MRNPARTATTSAALMVGLALVVFVAVFAAGLKTTFGGQLDRLRQGRRSWSSAEDFRAASRQRPNARCGTFAGVDAVTSLLIDQVEVNGTKSNIDHRPHDRPSTRRSLHERLRVRLGRTGRTTLVAQLGAGDALIEEQFAKAHGLEVGDRYRIRTPSGGGASLRVRAIYTRSDDPAGNDRHARHDAGGVHRPGPVRPLRCGRRGSGRGRRSAASPPCARRLSRRRGAGQGRVQAHDRGPAGTRSSTCSTPCWR